MQFDFGFRIDTGNKVGSGHFFRCLSIAEELIKNKFKVIFFCTEGNIENLGLFWCSLVWGFSKIPIL